MLTRILLAFVFSTSLSFGADSVRVVVLFKDKLRSLQGNRGKQDYLRIRRSLEENAHVSQMEFLADLRSSPRLTGEVATKPLWIVNAVIVDLPQREIAQLKMRPDVAGVFENRKVSIIRDFSEKRLNLAAKDSPDFTYGLNRLELPRLRDQEPELNGRGVRIGLIDTGVEESHPDLAGKILDFRDFTDPAGRRVPPFDESGHGTHMAGTLVGGGASGQRIGVAPGAKLLVARAFSNSGVGELAATLAAMQWMADPDGRPETADAPSVVSNSWGEYSPNAAGNPDDDVYCRAVNSWVALGIFPVFASGNSGPKKGTVSVPAACPGAFAVGATDEADQIADFSSRGPAVWNTGSWMKPNVSAPGVGVYSSFLRGTYASLSGTSMATPHVAGLLALMYQALPTIGVGDASALVERTATDLGPVGNDKSYGWGRVDAYRALEATKALRRKRL